MEETKTMREEKTSTDVPVRIEAGDTPIFRNVNGDQICVSGLINCIAVFLERITDDKACDGVIAGHFVTPTMFDEKTGTLTEKGIAFAEAFKKLKNDNIDSDAHTEISFYAAKKLDNTFHTDTEAAFAKLKEEMQFPEARLKAKPRSNKAVWVGVWFQNPPK